MMILKVSANRTLFIDEFWILIPTFLLVELLALLIIGKVRNKRKRRKKLKQAIERRERLRRIFLFATNMNNVDSFIARGGSEIGMNQIDPDAILDECGLEPGVFNLENDALINQLYKKFSKKAKKFVNHQTGRVLYITGSALCQFVRMYGPLILQDVGVSLFGGSVIFPNIGETLQKSKIALYGTVAGCIFVNVLIRPRFFAAPAAMLAGPAGAGLLTASIFAFQALRLYSQLPYDTFSKLNLEDLTPIDDHDLSTRCLEDIGPRKPNLDDVIVISNRETGEGCSLAPMQNEHSEQATLWSPFKPTKVEQDLSLVHHGLDADKDVITLEDVIPISGTTFSDKMDELNGMDGKCLPQQYSWFRSNIETGLLGDGNHNDMPKLPSKSPGAKIVDFKEKFPDIPSSETGLSWEDQLDIIGYE